MKRVAWKAGASKEAPGPLLVSATRFTYRSIWVMPGVFREGLWLRRHWAEFDGGLGISLAGSLIKRSTYAVSLWRDEQALRDFVRSDAHMRLVRGYRVYMESSMAVTWTVEQFSLGEAWREAMRRVGPPPSTAGVTQA